MNSWSSKKSPRLLRRGRVFLFFRLFSFFLLRCNFMTGVDCHTHADQRATSEILVSLHQFLAACVEASCHAACRQVRRVTNIYVLSFCVSSVSSFCILSNSSISVLLAGRTAFLLLCATAPQSGQRSGSFSAEKQ